MAKKINKENVKDQQIESKPVSENPEEQLVIEEQLPENDQQELDLSPDSQVDSKNEKENLVGEQETPSEETVVITEEQLKEAWDKIVNKSLEGLGTFYGELKSVDELKDSISDIDPNEFDKLKFREENSGYFFTKEQLENILNEAVDFGYNGPSLTSQGKNYFNEKHYYIQSKLA